MSDAITFLRTMIRILPSYLQGILEVIKENKDAFVDVLKDILKESSDVFQSFSDEVGALEEY